MPDGGYLRTHTMRPQAELHPEFFVDTVLDEPATAMAGREIYKSIERVKIIIPGMTATVVVHNVNQTHVARWPAEYDAFKRNEEMPIRGTPLEAWCLMRPATIKELKYHEIRTVEDLAGISDNAVSRLGAGYMNLRNHARAFLDDAAHESLRTSLEAECNGLRSHCTALQNQVDELNRSLAMIADENRRYAEESHMRRAYAEMPGRYAPQGYPPEYYPDPRGNGYVPPVPQGYEPPTQSAIDRFADVPVTSRHGNPEHWGQPEPAVDPPAGAPPYQEPFAPQYQAPPPREPHPPAPPQIFAEHQATPPAYAAPESHVTYQQPQPQYQAPPPQYQGAPERPMPAPTAYPPTPQPHHYPAGQYRNPDPPWGYGNVHNGPAPMMPPPGPQVDPRDLRNDIRAELERGGAVGTPVPENWVGAPGTPQ